MSPEYRLYLEDRPMGWVPLKDLIQQTDRAVDALRWATQDEGAGDEAGLLLVEAALGVLDLGGQDLPVVVDLEVREGDVEVLWVRASIEWGDPDEDGDRRPVASPMRHKRHKRFTHIAEGFA